MSDQRPVGAAMWGGALPATTPPEKRADPEQPDAPGYPPRMTARDAASLALTGGGYVSAVTGSALLWGAGGALATGGLLAVLVGIMIGVTA